ncbi:calcium/sodium antiporter [Irregularibacter muris]|uniref:Calcium/sodium antiporter n=1 Tax=Irregularibacter muris TaxID=1796619 RepID=A0AAE3HHH2_9FIRM|nr:calcium/sodium antiporter [Irregularibacter muris]MCR1899662.1 calcium/sodium antiporter [Irregularibacter muris]
MAIKTIEFYERKDEQIMLIPYIIFFTGFIFMLKGGDLFVDAATWLAKITRMPEVLIGATIVSLATTLPETMVSTLSSIHNETSMAIGNAIGSIICNTGLVLGICNIIKPSKIRSRIFYIKGIMLLLYIVAFWFLASSGVIQGISITILFIMLAIYIVFNLRVVQYQKDHQNLHEKKSSFTFKEVLYQFFVFIAGAAFILIGANLLVDYGVIIAEHWGVPSGIIAITILAFGTSLPEFITSVTAIRKGHAGLSMGNIIGSNILNISLVLGASASFNPLQFTTQNLALDIPVAFIINFLLIVPAFFTKRISRLQAFLIFLVYVVYMGFLILYYI